MQFLVINYWQWWILACILFIMEVLIPGTFLLWIGITAVITGLIVWLFGSVAVALQLGLFAILSVFSVILWHKFFRRLPLKSQIPYLNDRARMLIGQELILKTSLVQGEGKIIVNDTHWKVTGPDLKAGTKIKIHAVNGSVLCIEKVGK